MTLAFRALVACALLVAAACTDPRTDIVVRVDSDLRAGAELASVHVVVKPQEADAGPVADLTFPVGDGPGQYALPLDVVGVTPRGGDARRVITVTATALAPDGHALLTTQRAATFTPHVTTVLELILARACETVTCTDPNTSCGSDGTCTPVMQTDLPAWDGGAHPVCPSPQVTCNGLCVDPATDRLNCGACGVQCAEGATCSAGACVCPGGATVCSGRCVDTRSDPANCGACGRACSARCAAGVCHPAVSVAAGRAFSCATLDDGTGWCWGDDMQGELGRGTGMGGSSTRPVPIAAPSNAALIVAGSAHACLLTRTDARVFCWGNPFGGRLGTGGSAAMREDPSPVMLPAGVRTTQLSLGERHSCAVTSDGVYCWGASLGCADGSAMGTEPTPVHTMPRLPGAMRVAASGASGTNEDFSLALDPSGALYGWGANTHYALMTVMLGGTVTSATALPDPRHYERIAAGADFACGLRAGAGAGPVFCWGAGAAHRLGVASVADSPTPVAAVLPGAVTDVSASNGHACALLATGDVWCWGEAVIPGGRATTPTLLLGPSVAMGAAAPALHTERITAIACGPDHDCALDTNGGVICWGVNSDGQLGVGNSSPTMGPVRVSWD